MIPDPSMLKDFDQSQTRRKYLLGCHLTKAKFIQGDYSSLSYKGSYKSMIQVLVLYLAETQDLVNPTNYQLFVFQFPELASDFDSQSWCHIC